MIVWGCPHAKVGHRQASIPNPGYFRIRGFSLLHGYIQGSVQDISKAGRRRSRPFAALGHPWPKLTEYTPVISPTGNLRLSRFIPDEFVPGFFI